MGREFNFDMNDVNNWVNCDSNAGKKIWLDSDFAKIMANYAIREVRNYLFKKKIFIPKRGPFQFEEESWSLVLDIQKEIKDRINGNKIKDKEKILSDKFKFIKYVKKTLIGRLKKSVLQYINQNESIFNEIKSGKNEKEILIIDTLVDRGQNEEIIIKKIDSKKCSEEAEFLLNSFKESQFSTKSIKNRIDLLLQISKDLDIPGSLGVIFFIEEGLYSQVFRERARNKNESFNNAVWDSYNKRFRDQWERFLESEEGKNLNEKFRRSCEWIK